MRHRTLKARYSLPLQLRKAVRRVFAGILLRFERHRAPTGGVSISGREYRGGQFIPSSELKKAPKAVRERIEGEKSGREKSLRRGGKPDAAALMARVHRSAGDRQLTDAERSAARKVYAGLKSHHGELLHHRLEKLIEQDEKAMEEQYGGAGREGQEHDRAVRDWLRGRLRAYHEMLGWEGVEAKGAEPESAPAPAGSLASDLRGAVAGAMAPKEATAPKAHGKEELRDKFLDAVGNYRAAEKKRMDWFQEKKDEGTAAELYKTAEHKELDKARKAAGEKAEKVLEEYLSAAGMEGEASHLRSWIYHADRDTMTQKIADAEKEHKRSQRVRQLTPEIEASKKELMANPKLQLDELAVGDYVFSDTYDTPGMFRIEKVTHNGKQVQARRIHGTDETVRLKKGNPGDRYSGATGYRKITPKLAATISDLQSQIDAAGERSTS